MVDISIVYQRHGRMVDEGIEYTLIQRIGSVKQSVVRWLRCHLYDDCLCCLCVCLVLLQGSACLLLDLSFVVCLFVCVHVYLI